MSSAAVMAVRRPLREAWWWFKGMNVANPPLPADVRSMLFVCLGNICRSPFAELIAARRLEQARDTRIRCASAGIRTTQAARPPDDAREVARTFGVSLDAHRPQTLTRKLVDEYDLIVVMELQQLEILREAYPDAADRIVLLPLFDSDAATPYERVNIQDPFARPREAFVACYQRIDRSVDALLLAVCPADMSARVMEQPC